MPKSDPYRILYESSRDALMTLRPADSVFLGGNPAAVSLFGCRDEAHFRTLSPAQTSPRVQPDGSLSSVKAAAMISRAVEHGTHSFEWMHCRVDGSPFWADVLLTRMKVDGEVLLQANVRDISDRKLAEEKVRRLNQELEERIHQRTAELLETTERTRKLIDTANDAVVTIDEDSIIIDWNAAAVRIFGFGRDEAMGRKLHHLIVPEQFRAMHEAGMRRFIETGKGTIINKRIEIRALHRDGHEIDIELAIWPVRAGSSYTFSAFCRDISERKFHEQQLRERAERISHQRDVLVELARDGKSDFSAALVSILRASASTLRVERVSFWRLAPEKTSIVCEQLYLRSCDALDPSAPGVRLEARDFPDYFAAVLQRQPLAADDALSHPATAAFASSYLNAFGIVSMFDAAVWHGGEIIGVVCHEQVGEPRSWLPEEMDFGASIATMISLAIEASNRSQAERELLALQSTLRNTLAEREAILENSSVGICFIRQQSFIWVNRTMETMSGYLRDEIAGQPLSLFMVTPEMHERLLAGAHHAISQGLPYCVETQIRRRDGSLLSCRFSGRAIDPSHPLDGSIWTVEDISERIRAEEEMRLALEKERELNELKTRFVSMTSHEFRTPLSTVLSSAELLEHYHERLPEEEKRELFQSIRTAVQRMTAMMNDVLIIGRADSDRLELNPRRLDVKALCDQIVEEIRRSLPPSLDFRYTPGHCPPAWLDEKLIHYILGNLLSNAVKYSPSGGIVEFSFCAQDGNVLFSVSDQGIGIPPEDIPRLFESFHRARNVGNISGTGLGLSIVKKAVDRHGGAIEVHSRVGEGTSFRVAIPMGEAHG